MLLRVFKPDWVWFLRQMYCVPMCLLCDSLPPKAQPFQRWINRPRRATHLPGSKARGTLAAPDRGFTSGQGSRMPGALAANRQRSRAPAHILPASGPSVCLSTRGIGLMSRGCYLVTRFGGAWNTRGYNLQLGFLLKTSRMAEHSGHGDSGQGPGFPLTSWARVPSYLLGQGFFLTSWAQGPFPLPGPGFFLGPGCPSCLRGPLHFLCDLATLLSLDHVTSSRPG